MASAGFVPASSHFTNGKFVTAVSRPSCRKQQSWTAQRVRLPARCCVEVLDHEPAIREQPVELADCIDGVGCRPSFNRATSEECVFGVQLAFRRIIAVGAQRENVIGSMPPRRRQGRQQRLGHQPCFDHEPGARPEAATHCRSRRRGQIGAPGRCHPCFR